MVKEGYKEVRIGPKTKLIPEEWKVKKLKKIIKKRKGKRPNKLFESKDGENFIPYLSVNYLRGNDLPEWCLKNDNNKVEVKENEILMIWDGSYSGNVFVGFNGALSSTMARLKCEDDINNQYLFYQLRNNFKIFQSTTIGTSVPHVAGKVFENLNIPTPEKEEQKKIASILSSVDKSIEKTDEVIEETKKLKKGLMQQLLTKGIGHSKFKEVKVRAKSVSIPNEWELIKLKNVTDISGGYAFKSKDFIDEHNEDSYQVIRIGNIQMNNLAVNNNPVYIKENKLSEREYKYLLNEGEIVITITGTVSKRDYGDLVLIKEDKKYLLNQRNGRINVNGDTNNSYVFYYLQTKFFRDQFFLDGKGGTGNQENVSIRDIKKMLIAIPPLEEQREIASILSSVDTKIKKEEEYKTKLERLKKGLMQKLLTGEIRVNTDMEV